MDADDRIRRALERLGDPADPAGWLDRVRRRRNRARLIRRAQTGTLAVVVVAGSVGGFLALNDTFDAGGDRRGAGASDEIGFVRTVRACPGHPDKRGPDSELFVVGADGNGERNISDHSMHDERRSRNEQQPDWSPDGSRIAWVDRYLGDLFLTDGEGQDLVRLTHGMNANLPEWSPDGSLIAFAGAPAREFATAASHVYVVDPASGSPMPLTSGDDFRDSSPTWSPDGSQIAFLREPIITETSGGVTSINFGPPSLWIMNRDGSQAEELIAAPEDVTVLNGEWSPDGSRFVGEAVVDENHDIYVIDIATQTLARLTDDPTRDQSPSWSPDGTKIVFSAIVDERREIVVMDANGSSRVQVTDNCWVDYEPTWLPP